VFMGWLGDARPDLVARYEQLYSRGAYAPSEERKRLSRMIRRRGQSRRFVHASPAQAQAPRGEQTAQQALF
jgi:hypothetical protein